MPNRFILIIATKNKLVTQVIVHLAKHFGNIFILLIFLFENWCHVPDHHLTRILPLKIVCYIYIDELQKASRTHTHIYK